MEYIFRTIVAALLTYVLTEILKRVMFPSYPEGKEYELYYKKYEIYKNLYYTFCLDFYTGEEIDFQKNHQQITRNLKRLYKFYIYHSEESIYLSNSFQKQLRKHFNTQKQKDFKILQRNISSTFYDICRRLQFEYFHPKIFLKGFRIIFYLLAFLTLLLCAFSIILYQFQISTLCLIGATILTAIDFLIFFFLL